MLHFIHFKNHQFTSVQSLDPLDRRGRHAERLSRDPFPVFSAGGLCRQFWHGQRCPLFDVVHPALPLPTTASPTLQGALKDGFGEAEVACNMPEPYKSSSLDSRRKRFLWTYREAGLVFRVEDAERFPQAFGFQTSGCFSLSKQTGSMSHRHRGG